MQPKALLVSNGGLAGVIARALDGEVVGVALPFDELDAGSLLDGRHRAQNHAALLLAELVVDLERHHAVWPGVIGRRPRCKYAETLCTVEHRLRQFLRLRRVCLFLLYFLPLQDLSCLNQSSTV